jgi:hypothetical protein
VRINKSRVIAGWTSGPSRSTSTLYESACRLIGSRQHMTDWNSILRQLLMRQSLIIEFVRSRFNKNRRSEILRFRFLGFQQRKAQDDDSVTSVIVRFWSKGLMGPAGSISPGAASIPSLVWDFVEVFCQLAKLVNRLRKRDHEEDRSNNPPFQTGRGQGRFDQGGSPGDDSH